ncbi:DoxX family protein [Streptomyces sp. NBC_00237]|uniref:DoxX family protein n=1 Tax=Streptomyces sp. NBC_00237 TaxID=2975687 RepID=UPI0022584A5A|nr:DoxX family protein [Streptomyces sp. NBC_00237]MCX5206544.1 DoxX family protein [Streptomyces sp. NBC_00237]
MYAAYLTVALLTILANASVAATDLSGAKFVQANAAEVHVPASWIPPLALLKAAGALGLLLGLLGLHPLGLAAATGLVLFFTGALIAHVRARVFHNIAFPGTYFALSVATLLLMLAETTTVL